MMMVKNEAHFKTTTIDITDKTILIYTDGLTEGYVKNKEELTVNGFENEIKKIKTKIYCDIAELRLVKKFNKKNLLKVLQLILAQ